MWCYSRQVWYRLHTAICLYFFQLYVPITVSPRLMQVQVEFISPAARTLLKKKLVTLSVRAWNASFRSCSPIRHCAFPPTGAPTRVSVVTVSSENHHPPFFPPRGAGSRLVLTFVYAVGFRSWFGPGDFTSSKFHVRARQGAENSSLRTVEIAVKLTKAKAGAASHFA